MGRSRKSYDTTANTYTYDAAGNRISLRKRDGLTLTYAYDALNRMTAKYVPERAGLPPTHTRDVYYGYDVRDLQGYARFDSASGEGVTNAYDGFGRPLSSTLAMDGVSRTLSYLHDASGNRVRITHADGQWFGYSYDAAGRLTQLSEPAGGVLAISYDALGRRSAATGAAASAWGYDPVSRLASLSHDLASGGSDIALSLTRNPADQIVTRSGAHGAYAWTGHVDVDRGYAANGLNQYTAAGPATFTHDTNGNLTSDTGSGSGAGSATTFIYDVENRLVGASGARIGALRYDPLGRLYELAAAWGTTRFLHDGAALVMEHDAAGNFLRRFVHGGQAGSDDPMLWYGAGVPGANRLFLHADERGSVIAVSDANGAAVAINAYDEYGIPAAGNVGRFLYTGQVWIPELGMYYYKARMYSAHARPVSEIKNRM